jgi:hypothetical protein
VKVNLYTMTLNCEAKLPVTCEETRWDPKSASAGTLTRERERMPSQYRDRSGKVAMFLALRLCLENMEALTDSLGSQKRSPLRSS